MCWTELVNTRIKARRQILFSKEDPLLQPLTQALSRQNRRTVVLWALEQAESSVALLVRKYPGELRPQEAVDAARAWSAGYIKMPLARQAILSCHGLAKELDDPADQALCHAVGQAASVVHTPGHAMGYPIYALTALVRREGWPQCASQIQRQADRYLDRLLYWHQAEPAHSGPWASFLHRETVEEAEEI